MEEKSTDVEEVVVRDRSAELAFRFERREALELWIEGGMAEKCVRF